MSSVKKLLMKLKIQAGYIDVLDKFDHEFDKVLPFGIFRAHIIADLWR